MGGYVFACVYLCMRGYERDLCICVRETDVWEGYEHSYESDVCM